MLEQVADLPAVVELVSNAAEPLLVANEPGHRARPLRNVVLVPDGGLQLFVELNELGRRIVSQLIAPPGVIFAYGVLPFEQKGYPFCANPTRMDYNNFGHMQLKRGESP